MGLFNIFRRRPPIREPEALARFIDENAAFVAQKGIYEYSRARAGHYSKVLFREPDFQLAVEQSRWRAYPLGLAMVAELVDGQLRLAHERENRAPLDVLRTMVLSVYDRYAVPAAIDQAAWQGQRDELERRLQSIGLHPPKRAMDVPEPFAKLYFDLMPIHATLRGRDFSTTRNYLRVTMCNVHEDLAERLDVPALTQALAQMSGMNSAPADTGAN